MPVHAATFLPEPLPVTDQHYYGSGTWLLVAEDGGKAREPFVSDHQAGDPYLKSHIFYCICRELWLIFYIISITYRYDTMQPVTFHCCICLFLNVEERSKLGGYYATSLRVGGYIPIISNDPYPGFYHRHLCLW